MRGRKAWSENLFFFTSREELPFAEIFLRSQTDPYRAPIFHKGEVESVPSRPNKVSFRNSSKPPLLLPSSSQRPEQDSFKAAETDVAPCGLDNLPDTSHPKWFRWSIPSAHASSPLMPDRRQRSPLADRWATDPVQQPTPTTCPTGPVKIKEILERWIDLGVDAFMLDYPCGYIGAGFGNLNYSDSLQIAWTCWPKN